MFADQFASAVARADFAALTGLQHTLWRAYGAGHLTDAEAQGFAKLGQALMWELHAEFDTAIEAIADARTFLEGKGPSNEAWVYGVESRIQLHRQEFELAQESAKKGLERIRSNT